MKYEPPTCKTELRQERTLRGSRGPAPSNPPGVIWCANRTSEEPAYGWGFPTKVKNFLQLQSDRSSTLHLFGGRASWGTRMDIDPIVKPDVIADAWAPPFPAGSFEDVIVDPPYTIISQPEIRTLLAAALWCGRSRVWWLHTVWIPPIPGLVRRRSWLIRVGNYTSVRALIEFEVTMRAHEKEFNPATGQRIRYKGWQPDCAPGLFKPVSCIPPDGEKEN